MAIVVNCSCGKRLKAPDTAAGKRVRCPACETVLTVPKPADHDPPNALMELVEEGETSGSDVCPGCKNPLAPGSVFCVNCGLDLRTGKQVGKAAARAKPKQSRRRKNKGAWKTVRIGLTLVYWGLMSLVAGILLLVAVAIVAIVGALLGAAGPNAVGGVAVILAGILAIGGLVCIGVAPLLQFIGQCMCLAAPVERIRMLAIGALVCNLLWPVLFVLVVVQGMQQQQLRQQQQLQQLQQLQQQLEQQQQQPQQPLQQPQLQPQQGSVLQIALSAAFWAQPILFLLFMRGIARGFRDHALADRVKNLLIFLGVLLAISELLSILQLAQVPAVAAMIAILGLGVAIAMLVAFAWYIGVVRDVRSLLP